MKKNLKKTFNQMLLLKKFGNKPLVLSLGMPRSGSTLMFNLLKQILLSKSDSTLASGWIKDVHELSSGDVYLIKAHELDHFYRFRAWKIFYTFRDPRVALVSANKIFNIPFSIDFVDFHVNQYLVCKKYANICIEYHQLVEKPLSFCRDAAEILGVELNLSCIKVPTKQEAKNSTYNDTLFHSNHITNTMDVEWRNVLPIGLQREIAKKYGWWLKMHNYSLH